MIRPTSIFAGTAAGLLMAASARAEPIAWTQYVAGGVEVRAITDAAACPLATIDGATVTMAVRAAPGPGYPVTTCAAVLPAVATSVSVAGAAVALPNANPKRIAVIGDTGCRLKGSYTQACNDAAQWPFARIAAHVAAAKPDLIIHVGDYHYRETPCPAGQAGCAGSPFGDSWDAWRTDFFAPAAELLRVAPWVAVRGNHEDCERGGQGWSRTLEPAPFDAATGCNGPAPVFTVPLAGLTLAVVDTAIAAENKLNAREAEVFAAQYARLAELGPGPFWLLQHRPIWSAGGTAAGFPYGDNKTLAAAARTTLPASVALMLSGHHHIFQALTYVEDLPAQIVAGHGGDYLNLGKSADPTGWIINGVTVASGLHDVGTFGYLLFERQGDGAAATPWVATNYDAAGAIRHVCDLAGRRITCRPK